VTCTLRDPGKPTFTLAALVSALASNAAGLRDLLAAFAGPGRIDPALREGVMVSVSRMNRCRHCTAIHSAWGESVGLALEGEPGEPLASAARYARCLLAGADPAPSRSELARLLPEQAIRQVEAVTRLIDLANRCGNTWDAFLARLDGRAAAGASLADELGVLLALAPFGLPFLIVSSAVRLRGGEPHFD
jgi:AhpD family alkylhydroperoxidase